MVNSGIVKKIGAIGLALVMTMSVVGCNGNNKKKEEKKEPEKVYTYNTYVMKGEDPMNEVKKYTEMGLVDVQVKGDGTWEWCYEMATSIKDVTASFGDKEKWNIPAQSTGRVWEIRLNKSATFEEGTPITADTYIKSMSMLLLSDDTERIKSYTDKDINGTSLQGAMGYTFNNRVGEDIIGTLASCGYKTVEEALAKGVSADKIMLDVKSAFGIECNTATGFINYQDTTTKMVDIKGALGKAGDKVTAKALYDELFAANAKYAKYVSEYIYIPTGEKYAEVSFDTVGLIKVDDYTLYYITEASVSEFDFYQTMRANWITYEATKADKTSDENEDADKESDDNKQNAQNKKNVYVSYGPYKLKSYKTKKITLEKNDKWYGYDDKKHAAQFQTTDIVIDVVSTHAEVIQMYESGQLDYVELKPESMAAYAQSEKLQKIDVPYIYRWVFATELDDLIALEVAEGQGNNKRVLSYDEFRKAMSLTIDRTKICEIAGINYVPANYLINGAYYTDMAHNQTSLYRDAAGEVSASATTNDIDAAKALFKTVYDRAILNKNYKDGQKIQINCIVGDYSQLTEADKAEEKALNEMLAKATEGTGFDGKISIVYQCSNTDRYSAVASGQIEMIKSAWGGDVYDPFTLIRCYTDEDYAGVVQESCGWNPAAEKVTITYDFDGDGKEDTVAKTFLQWSKSIQKDGEYATNMALRTHILSCIENGIVEAYQCIPWGMETKWTLTSEKIKYGTEKYSPMYDFGGVRHISYSYEDKEWKDYIKTKK